MSPTGGSSCARWRSILVAWPSGRWGSIIITTSLSGSIQWTAPLEGVSFGEALVATAVDEDGNTSEFSDPLTVDRLPTLEARVATFNQSFEGRRFRLADPVATKLMLDHDQILAGAPNP